MEGFANAALRRAPAACGFAFTLREKPTVRPCDGPEDGGDRRREQNKVGTRETPQDRFRIARRHRGKLPVSERLNDKNDEHEYNPDCGHESEPPERRIGKPGPQIETPSHPQSGQARERDRNAHLGREATLDRLEQRPTFPRVFARSGKGQGDKGDEGDAADPMHDEQHVESAGEFDVVDHR